MPHSTTSWKLRVQIIGVKSWRRLDKYDSNFEQIWLDAYNANALGDTSLVLEKVINLTSTFNLGDTVFLRFRLIADGFIEGWGWWIDNINVIADPSQFLAVLMPTLISKLRLILSIQKQRCSSKRQDPMTSN